jgi:hypothetical protein
MLPKARPSSFGCRSTGRRRALERDASPRYARHVHVTGQTLYIDGGVDIIA